MKIAPRTRHSGSRNPQKFAHENLPWPGLKARDRLSRVITKVVKEAREAKERERWAMDRTREILNVVSPTILTRLVLSEIVRRRARIHLEADTLRLLEKLIHQSFKGAHGLGLARR